MKDVLKKMIEDCYEPKDLNFKYEIFFEFIKKIIKDEIWQSHKLSPDFLKKYNIGIDEEKEINELCMKSHNEVLEELIKKIK